MMRLSLGQRAVSLRRSFLRLSPAAIRVPAEPYSDASSGQKPRGRSNPDYRSRVETKLNQTKSWWQRGHKKGVDRPDAEPTRDEREARRGGRATGPWFYRPIPDDEKLYRILLQFHSRVPKLELALRQSGIVIREGLIERVLDRCGDAGTLAYRFFAWASKQPGFIPSCKVYLAMVTSLGKMQQFGSVWALLEEMRNNNPHLITPEIFVVLMERFAAVKMVKNAVQVLEEMPKYGCKADEYVFGCLLDALCKNGWVKEAALLFEEINMKFKPNLKHFTSLMYGWCRKGKLMEAKAVLMNMKKAGLDPDIAVYNNLLIVYAHTRKISDAYELLKDMRMKEGCEPNARSYTILIQALCKDDRMEEATRLFVEMDRNNCKADVVTYTAYIRGFCNLGKIKKAYRILDDMIACGVSPTVEVYMPIMLAHEREDQLEECIELMEEMRQVGCFPNLTNYDVVIRLSCNLGEADVAIRLWDEMEASGLSPGLDTFTVMIRGLIKQNRSTEACRYFKEMVERGLLSVPQYEILKEMMNHLIRANELEMAKEMWKLIAGRASDVDIYAWTIWIHALFDGDHLKEACAYCLDMMEADVLPQPDTFKMLMNGLKKLYNCEIAAEITDKVRRMSRERNVTFKKYKKRGVYTSEQKAGGRIVKRKRMHMWFVTDRDSPKYL